jgi:glucose/mannose-6-phosphate isomerase
VRARIRLTREVIEDQAVFTDRIETIGETRVERLVSLVLLGDLMSLYLAALRGQDPAQTASLTRLKSALAGQVD